MKTLLTIFTLLASITTFASQTALDCITDDWNNDTRVKLEVIQENQDFLISVSVKGEMVKPIIKATGQINESNVNLVFEDDRGSLAGQGFAGFYPLTSLNMPEKDLSNLEVTCTSDLF